MSIRCLLATTLFLAAATANADEPAAAPAAADASPAAVEIVREGAGVAEVWRREGVDFPAYGPDGAPVAPTAEAQALQALANAYDVQYVALGSAIADDHAAGAPAPCTTESDCIGEHRVAGRVRVENVAQYRLARAIGDSWLRGTTEAAATCVPQYRHALTYSADGHAWEVLLGYACGRYLLRRDGVAIAEGVAGDPTGLAEFDALLASAGVVAESVDAAD